MTIDAPPRRIVAPSDQRPLDSLLSLVVEPIAIGQYYGGQRYHDGLLPTGAQLIDVYDGLNLELITAAQPDLILCDDFQTPPRDRSIPAHPALRCLPCPPPC